MEEDSKPRYDEEYLSEEDSLELLQQKSYINVLFDGGQVQYVNQAEHRKYDMRESTEGNIGEDVVVLEEAEREILLLENLLKKSESNWKLGLQVEELCFNNLDEEMKYFEEHIGNDEGIKDSVGVLPSSKHENDMAEKDIFRGTHEVKVAEISTAMCGAAFVQEDDNRGQLLNIVQKFEDDE
jgi:hypothetical protein